MVHSKIEGKVQRFLIYCLLPALPSPTFSFISIPHQSSISVTTDKPTLTHHNHLKSTVHSQCLLTCGPLIFCALVKFYFTT